MTTTAPGTKSLRCQQCQATFVTYSKKRPYVCKRCRVGKLNAAAMALNAPTPNWERPLGRLVINPNELRIVPRSAPAPPTVSAAQFREAVASAKHRAGEAHDGASCAHCHPRRP